MRVVNKREIEIRIFERGVGPTTSSGTGSSASATAALASNGCISPLTVVAPGGAQTVAWDGPGTELWLTGPASSDCAGRGLVKMPAQTANLLKPPAVILRRGRQRDCAGFVRATRPRRARAPIFARTWL